MKNVNQDVFASFADAQMSKEEMKMVKGGHKCNCTVTASDRIRGDDQYSGQYWTTCDPGGGANTFAYRTFHAERIGTIITYNC